jgi:hypothetical protein
MDSATAHQLKTIRAKKQAALSLVARHEELAAKARAEAVDYEAAERVLLRLFGDGDSRAGGLLRTLSAVIEEAAEPDEKAQGKPPGVPPVPDMILESLHAATEDGAPGLTPTGMLSFIKGKYWPQARSVDVSSTAWRMWKDGRLTKPDENSPIYGLSRGNEDAA